VTYSRREGSVPGFRGGRRVCVGKIRTRATTRGNALGVLYVRRRRRRRPTASWRLTILNARHKTRRRVCVACTTCRVFARATGRLLVRGGCRYYKYIHARIRVRRAPAAVVVCYCCWCLSCVVVQRNKKTK